MDFNVKIIPIGTEKFRKLKKGKCFYKKTNFTVKYHLKSVFVTSHCFQVALYRV